MSDFLDVSIKIGAREKWRRSDLLLRRLLISLFNYFDNGREAMHGGGTATRMHQDQTSAGLRYLIAM